MLQKGGLTMTLEKCWNCGDSRILCNLRHFSNDVVVPILAGMAIGAVIGGLAALAHNAWVTL
jgi:hypothetical protein